MQVTLALSEAEARELKRALDLHLKEEELEVARTEDHEFRHSLVEGYELLAAVRAKLERELGGKPDLDVGS